MGIKDWLDFCKVPKRRTNSLGERKGKIFAVDASSWMHKILSSWSLGSVPTRLFHQFPPRNMQYVVDTWMTYTMEYLKSFDVQVVLVFDGARNPRKDREDAERGDDIECNIPYLHLSLSLSLSLSFSLSYTLLGCWAYTQPPICITWSSLFRSFNPWFSHTTHWYLSVVSKHHQKYYWKLSTVPTYYLSTYYLLSKWS